MMHPGGSVPRVVSSKYDGVLQTRGWRWWSTNSEMRSTRGHDGSAWDDSVGEWGVVNFGEVVKSGCFWEDRHEVLLGILVEVAVVCHFPYQLSD